MLDETQFGRRFRSRSARQGKDPESARLDAMTERAQSTLQRDSAVGDPQESPTSLLSYERIAAAAREPEYPTASIVNLVSALSVQGDTSASPIRVSEQVCG